MTRSMTEEEARERLIELGKTSLEKERKQYQLRLRLALTFVVFAIFEIVFFCLQGVDFNVLYLLLLIVNLVVLIALIRSLIARHRTNRQMLDMLRALYDGRGTDCLARLEKLGQPITVEIADTPEDADEDLEETP